jgi:hypothetical protein
MYKTELEAIEKELGECDNTKDDELLKELQELEIAERQLDIDLASVEKQEV